MLNSNNGSRFAWRKKFTAIVTLSLFVGLAFQQSAIARPVAIAALAPVTRTSDGFTSSVTNYDPFFTYSITSTVGVVTPGTPSGSTLDFTVTGLTPTQAATVRVLTSRSGYANGNKWITGAALPRTGLVATFGLVTKTVDGFTSSVTNYAASFDFAITTTAGSVSAGSPSGSTLPFTVTGLTPGQVATVRVQTTRSGYANGNKWITGAALPRPGLVATLSPAIKTFGGFTSAVTNYDPPFGFTFTTTAGTVIGGTPSGSSLPFTVTGLAPGQVATVRVQTTRSGYANGNKWITSSSVLR